MVATRKFPKTGVTHTLLFDVRDTLKARGFRHTRSDNRADMHQPDVTAFGSFWVREADGAEFWLNYKTIDSLPR